LEWPGRDAWPLLLLLLAVLVPTGFLLWFMSDAIVRQSAASRQTALEAYRDQLRLLRARTDLLWQPYADRLEHERSVGLEKPTPPTVDQRFAQLVLEEELDGAVLLDADGRISFPHPTGTRAVKRVSPDAMSVQAAVRELVQRGERTRALERIEQFIQRGDARAVGPDGRLIAADLQLVALQGLLPDDPKRSTRTKRLASLLNDYDVSMPSAQRLFVMGELRRMTPEIRLPTEDALRLSTQFMEGGTPPQEPRGFRPTLTRDIWALTSANRRIIGLYRTRHLHAMLDDALGRLAPQGIRFLAYPPDASGDQEAIAAGPSLPGWQMSFAVLDSSPVDAVARGRLLTYLWVGFAGIATIALLGIVAGQTFGRQLRLARLKTDLTAAVSHELRAPLASVRVLVDGLLGDKEFDPVKTREYLQLIAVEHARLSRVIEHFLTFARLERARERFVLVPTRPSTIITASIDAIRDRTPAGCDLRVEMSDDLPPVMADPDALGTALINLLDNALKFTPDEKQILVRAYVDDRSVMFAVRDNGTGIPVREQRRIFRRFYRVDQRLARETAGVGLGLSIVALIVRAHGGQIEVSSQPGAGSTFALRLPAVNAGRA
jgi:two-component system phosphate regulon sensor histidine kinase PhoR